MYKVKYDYINHYDLNPLVERVIDLYGLNDDEVRQLMNPISELSYNNSIILDNIVNRLNDAKKRCEKVFIVGDYDTDGVMATTILKDTLDYLQIENGYYIPSRYKDGYGLNEKIVRLAYDKGYRLIITCDNGVSAIDAINECHRLGIDIIVTDHHLINQKIEVYDLLHPTLLDNQFKAMCGAGLALEISKRIHYNEYHVVLAMIATIGDVMPLWNENRILVKLGLYLLNKYRYLPIVSLLDDKFNINETDIAFKVVPKINAVGRMVESNANNLVKYLLLKDIMQINLLKNQINAVNDKRKYLSNEMLVKASLNSNDLSVNVVYDSSYLEGICGLVAGNLANKLKKPTVVLNEKDGLLKGSARSIPGVDLYAYLNKYNDLYMTFGGHASALGISLKKDNLASLLQLIKEEPLIYPEVEIECIGIDLNDININDIKELLKLAPFGEGFKKPLFCFYNFEVLEFKMLKNQYPKWKLSNNFSAIDFSPNYEIKEKPKFIYGTLDINVFLGNELPQIIVRDIE